MLTFQRKIMHNSVILRCFTCDYFCVLLNFDHTYLIWTSSENCLNCIEKSASSIYFFRWSQNASHSKNWQYWGRKIYLINKRRLHFCNYWLILLFAVRNISILSLELTQLYDTMWIVWYNRVSPNYSRAKRIHARHDLQICITFWRERLHYQLRTQIQQTLRHQQ